MKIYYKEKIPIFDKFIDGILIEPDTLGERQILKLISSSGNIPYISLLAKVINHNEGLLLEITEYNRDDLIKLYNEWLQMNIDVDKNN